MKMLPKLLALFLLVLHIRIIVSDFFGSAGPPNFIYQKFSNCAKRPTVINMNIIPKWINKTCQVLDVNLTTPIPLGNNLLTKVVAYTSVENRWLHLTNLTNKFCYSLRDYLGPLRKITLASVGLPENSCPIPEGNYRARNVDFDMKNSRIPLCPYGLFKVDVALHDISTDEMKLCIEILMENKST